MVFWGLAKSVTKGLYKGFEKVFTGVTQPAAAIITKGIGKVTGKTFVPRTKEQMRADPVHRVLTKAAFIPAVALVAATGLISKGAKALIPKSAVAKVSALGAGLIGYGILKESPKAQATVEKAIESFPDQPSKAIGFGGEIGKVIEKEKVFGSEKIMEGAKAAGVVGAVAAVGAIVIPKVFGKDKPAQAPSIPEIDPEKQLVTEKPVGIQGEVPITPETTTITTGKTPSKRRRATKTPSVRQYVRVNVINQAVGMR